MHVFYCLPVFSLAEILSSLALSANFFYLVLVLVIVILTLVTWIRNLQQHYLCHSNEVKPCTLICTFLVA